MFSALFFNLEASAVFYALIGGIVPALVWLWFWQREDSKKPEPRGLIMRTFLLGMLSVVLVLPLQAGVDNRWPGFGLLAMSLLAVLEEVFKFLAGYFGGIHTREDNEPIDPMIYMITAALGFAALENALFVAGPLRIYDYTGYVLTGNLRFIGPSLLHVVTSAMIGVSLMLTFYKPKWQQFLFGLVGLACGIVFHIGFNEALLLGANWGKYIAFGGVWAAVMIILLFFEKAKSIAR